MRETLKIYLQPPKHKCEYTTLKICLQPPKHKCEYAPLAITLMFFHSNSKHFKMRVGAFPVVLLFVITLLAVYNAPASWHPHGFTSFLPSHLPETRPRFSSFSDGMATRWAVTWNVPSTFTITRPSALYPSLPCLKHSQSPKLTEFPRTLTSMVEINPQLNPTIEIHPRSTHRFKGFRCPVLQHSMLLCYGTKRPFLYSHILYSLKTMESFHVALPFGEVPHRAIMNTPPKLPKY
jgi:hypothetical protein